MARSGAGVQPFGGPLFDGEGRVVLNQGGFANWLGWLKKAEENPNILLNRNPSELQELFMQGQAAYYIGSTEELPVLVEALGEDTVGVVRLPGRQDKAAGPFVQTEAILFSRVSTEQSRDIALRLGQYLTNTEQQRKLALNASKLPTNNRVKIDPRIAPIVAEFIAQSKTAVPISLADIDKLNSIGRIGTDTYGQVLEGEVSVGEAATVLTEQINEQYGLETVVVSGLDNCEVSGRLTVWNSWVGARAEVLRSLQDQFIRQCPEVDMRIVDQNKIFRIV